MTPPTWLTLVAWLSLTAGFLSTAAILYDIYGRGLRQPMRVMEAVWPITALYLGPLGLQPTRGSAGRRRKRRRDPSGRDSPSRQRIAAPAARSAT